MKENGGRVRGDGGGRAPNWKETDGDGLSDTLHTSWPPPGGVPLRPRRAEEHDEVLYPCFFEGPWDLREGWSEHCIVFRFSGSESAFLWSLSGIVERTFLGPRNMAEESKEAPPPQEGTATAKLSKTMERTDPSRTLSGTRRIQWGQLKTTTRRPREETTFAGGRAFLPGHSRLNVEDAGVTALPKFRVVSYNVLAQVNIGEALAYCLPSAVMWERRRAAILSEIRAFDAHIICLQGEAPLSMIPFVGPPTVSGERRKVNLCFACLTLPRRRPVSGLVAAGAERAWL